jgi:hypothetical protein
MTLLCTLGSLIASYIKRTVLPRKMNSMQQVSLGISIVMATKVKLKRTSGPSLNKLFTRSTLFRVRLRARHCSSLQVKYAPDDATTTIVAVR